jgi:hypothetical protein
MWNHNRRAAWRIQQSITTMKVGIFDSNASSPELPRGLLWRSDSCTETDLSIFKQSIQFASSALEEDGSRIKPAVPESYWGALRYSNCKVTYFIIPTGRDSFNRPGRYIGAIFIVQSPKDILWEKVFLLQKQLIETIPNRSSFESLVCNLADSALNDIQQSDLSDLQLSSLDKLVRKEIMQAICGQIFNFHLFLAFDTEKSSLIRTHNLNSQLNYLSTSNHHPSEMSQPRTPPLNKKTDMDPSLLLSNKRKSSRKQIITFLLFIVFTLGFAIGFWVSEKIGEEPKPTAIESQLQELEDFEKAVKEAVKNLRDSLSKDSSNSRNRN